MLLLISVESNLIVNSISLQRSLKFWLFIHKRLKYNRLEGIDIRISLKNMTSHRILILLLFLSCYVAPKKRARNLNHLRNYGLESYSNIFFTLIWVLKEITNLSSKGVKRSLAVLLENVKSENASWKYVWFTEHFGVWPMKCS